MPKMGIDKLCQPPGLQFSQVRSLEKVGLVEVVLHSKGENSEDWMAS